jgi:hypothetical protein
MEGALYFACVQKGPYPPSRQPSENTANFGIDNQSQFAIYSITDCDRAICGIRNTDVAGRVMIEE